MPDVSYQLELGYLRDAATGDPFPGLWVVVGHPGGDGVLEIQCHLDSGTEISLFDGQIAKGIGLELDRGEVQVYSSSTGAELRARLHRVRLGNKELGEHEMTIGFSERRIVRNLLGRDFFSLFQIGFREKHTTLLLAAES